MQIVVVGAAEQRECVSDVIDPPGEKADMIERRAEGMDAHARDRAKTRLESDDAIEGGRPYHRTERLRAQRQRDKTGRDRGGGAR